MPEEFAALRDKGVIVRAAVYWMAALGIVLGPGPTRFELGVVIAFLVIGQRSFRKTRTKRYGDVSFSVALDFLAIVLGAEALGVDPLASISLHAPVLAGAFMVGRPEHGWRFLTSSLVAWTPTSVAIVVLHGVPVSETAANFGVGLAGLIVLYRYLPVMSGAIKEAVESRERALRQEQVNSEFREQMIRTVSHELRTPLTSIQGFADLLATGQIEASEQGEFIRTILREANGLNRLLDDLVTSLRTERGELDFRIEAVSVRQTIDGVVGVLFDRKGRLIETQVDPTHVVMADPVRLSQILRNLIGNACKYGGLNVQVESRSEHDRIVISVTDDGPGIAVQDRARIFGDYQQVGLASSRTGSGLGLGIARRLAEGMGGTLELAGTNKTRFEIELPTA